MAMLPVRRSSGRNLTVVNPTREFEDIYDRMGQLMNLAFGLTPVDVAEGPWIPLADVSETDDAYVVEVDLPGVNRDRIDIQLQDRELVITGEIPESEQKAAVIAARAAPAGSSSTPTCPVTSTPTA
jgi:HSP20 family protein